MCVCHLVDHRRLVLAVVLGLLWWGLAALGGLAGVRGGASLWYPPAGLTFAAALVLKNREWPVLIVAVVIGTALGHGGTEAVAEPALHAVLILGQALAHALPFMLAAMALRALTAEHLVTAATPALATLVVWPLAAAGSAGLGAAIVIAGGELTPSAAAARFVPWLTGDLVGVATTGGFFALLLGPALRRLLGPDAVLATGDTPLWPSRLAVTSLALLAALALVALARTDAFAHLAGGVAMASYGAVLAVVLIARLAPPWQTHAALVVLTLAVMMVAAVPASSTRIDPQLTALTLAASVQLGVSMRDLAEASERDPLTGVANRRAWLAGCRRRLHSRGAAAVIMLDLDHFKTINDRFGHAVGDEVLRAAAKQLCLGAGPDAWVGRIGGEEFAALVPGRVGDAERRVQEIRRALRQVALTRDGEDLVVRASYGVAPVSSPAHLAAALDAADAALYRAKAAGRDRVAYARAVRHA
ncbi:MAG: GGDEF domain-containing protein [Alphaproteobacteria bacterium]